MSDHWLVAFPVTVYVGAFWGCVALLLILIARDLAGAITRTVRMHRRLRRHRRREAERRRLAEQRNKVALTADEVNNILAGGTVDG
jgi:hypothetical protein